MKIVYTSFFSTVSALVLAIGSAWSQQLPVPVQKAICDTRLEPMLGFGFNNVAASDDILDYQPSPALLLGFRTPIPLGENVKFVPGMALETKNHKAEYRISENAFEGFGMLPPRKGTSGIQQQVVFTDRINSTFLSFPWVLQFTPITRFKQLEFSVGANNSLILGQVLRSQNFLNEPTKSRGIAEDTRRLYFGLLAGIVYRIDHKIGIGAMYDHGLTSYSTRELFDIRDRTLRLTVSYRLPFNPLMRESFSRKGREKLLTY